MKADESLTIRVPLRIKEEIAEIAGENGLTLSKATIHLLAKAVAAYREDGVLIDARNRSVLNEPKPKLGVVEKRRAG